MTSKECIGKLSKVLFGYRRLPMLSLQTILPDTLELLKRLMAVPLLSPPASRGRDCIGFAININ